MAAAIKSSDRIKVTQTAYDLAMKLFDAEANKKPVPVTKEMLSSKLNELTQKKGVAIRQGASPGRFGKRGTVKLLVCKEDLVPIANRGPRKNMKYVSTQTTESRNHSTLSVNALEGFLKTYRDTEGPLAAERRKSVETRISDLQRHLAVAKGDDFRNTIAMANRELKNLDEIDNEVTKTVLDLINPGTESPLYSVWRAMKTGS